MQIPCQEAVPYSGTRDCDLLLVLSATASRAAPA